MNKTTQKMLNALQYNKSFKYKNIQVEPTDYGFRIFLFDELFAIISTSKRRVFVEIPKHTLSVFRYAQYLLDYYNCPVTVVYDNKEIYFVDDKGQHFNSILAEFGNEA